MAADIDRLIAERMDPTSLGYWTGRPICTPQPAEVPAPAIETNDRVITDGNPLIVT